jgi:heterodisulfide reductase subunit A
MTERIGVYVCHCGSNIAGTVDVESVARYSAALPGVVVSRDERFLCSEPGQALIAEDIREHRLTRIAIAACSPLLHERTFRAACARAGLNPYLLEIANIREQCSWVTADRAEATAKAEALVAGAVYRVGEHEPLELRAVPVRRETLVVGGGIAGIQAALELADAGYPVVLVEREPSIGGHMAQLDKTFPTLDCSACILTPKMVAVGQHPNITLLTYSEVEEVGGYIGSFVVRIRQKARYVSAEMCTGCGICEKKCPIRVVDDGFEAGLGYRKVIYTPFPQAVPKTPVIDRENCVYFQRGKCKACEIFCPTGAIDWDQEDRVLSVEVGNIILATGYRLFDARRVPQYGYGRLANVFTSLEFERMCSAAGPTEGRIVLRDGETEPRRVAIVHCVGSRDRNYNAYCSNVCCMYSLKFAHLVHEKLPESEVYNFYIDIRAPGKGYEEFYHRLLDEGTHFVRGKVAQVTDFAETEEEKGRLVVQAEDTLVGRQRRVPVDMVILSCGLEPQADAGELARRFGVSCGHDGFYIERHPKLDPVATTTEGVFIAGGCQGPQDIPSAVAQGAAAAARVAGLISRGEVVLEPVRARVDEAACSGCGECLSVCPYSAVELAGARETAHVIEALCKGCGVCVAACLPKAISLSHYTDEQLVAQVKGLLGLGPAILPESPAPAG